MSNFEYILRAIATKIKYLFVDILDIVAYDMSVVGFKNLIWGFFGMIVFIMIYCLLA